MRELGCSVVAGKKRKASSMEIEDDDDAADNGSKGKATLKVPLTFPKPKKGAQKK